MELSDNKSIFKLAKDSERTSSKMLIFCIVLIFAHIFMTFDIWIDDWDMFLHGRSAKFPIFKFPNVMEIYRSLQQQNNFANRSRIYKVIAIVKVAWFFLLTVYCPISTHPDNFISIPTSFLLSVSPSPSCCPHFYQSSINLCSYIFSINGNSHAEEVRPVCLQW